MNPEPLITCIMPTRNRRAWLPAAIACFIAQRYVNRELVILNAGDDPIDDLIPEPEMAFERIRLINTRETLNHGQMCNAACELARGKYIAHFDDDDYSAPGRLEYQIAALLNSGAQVSSFHAMKFLETDTGRWFQYTGDPDVSLGTSLVYGREFWKRNPFQPIPCGSDQFFNHAALAAKALHSSPDLDLMYATAHAGNTSPRSLDKNNYKPLPGFVPPPAWRIAQAA